MIAVDIELIDSCFRYDFIWKLTIKDTFNNKVWITKHGTEIYSSVYDC